MEVSKFETDSHTDPDYPTRNLNGYFSLNSAPPFHSANKLHQHEIQLDFLVEHQGHSAISQAGVLARANAFSIRAAIAPPADA